MLIINPRAISQRHPANRWCAQEYLGRDAIVYTVHVQPNLHDIVSIAHTDTVRISSIAHKAYRHDAPLLSCLKAYGHIPLASNRKKMQLVYGSRNPLQHCFSGLQFSHACPM
jgi:hypothetical protein